MKYPEKKVKVTEKTFKNEQLKHVLGINFLQIEKLAWTIVKLFSKYGEKTKRKLFDFYGCEFKHECNFRHVNA